MTRAIGFVGAALVLSVGCGAEQVEPDSTTQDALIVSLPPAAQLTPFNSGLGYGDQISFSYTKVQAQAPGGYAFATRLSTMRQDTIKATINAGTTGSFFLVERGASRYQIAVSKDVTEAGKDVELTVTPVNDIELWAIFVPKLVSTSPVYATATLRLRATPGQPWSAEVAAAVRMALLGADNLQRPWSKAVATAAAVTLAPESLNELAAARFAQLQLRTGTLPTGYRWSFGGREFHVVQSASGLNGTLDIYFNNGRWLTGATLTRDSVTNDISTGFMVWVDR